MSFSHWRERIHRLITSEEGPTAVEYAIMLALIVVACIGAVGSLATATGSSFDRSSQAINQALSG